MSGFMKWFNEHGFKYVILIVILALFYVYHDNIKAFLRPTPAPQINVTVPKQEVTTKETIVREVAIEKPSREGEVVSFSQRDGKVFVIVGDGKEIEVPNITGKPTAEIGKDGTLRITQETRAVVDLKQPVEEQARLIAQKIVDKEVEKVKKETKKDNRGENVKWGGIGTVFGFVAGLLVR